MIPLDVQKNDIDKTVREILQDFLDKKDNSEDVGGEDSGFCDDCGKKIPNIVMDFCKRNNFDGIFCRKCQSKHKPKPMEEK